jgi:hypothetical protein
MSELSVGMACLLSQFDRTRKEPERSDAVALLKKQSYSRSYFQGFASDASMTLTPTDIRSDIFLGSSP